MTVQQRLEEAEERKKILRKIQALVEQQSATAAARLQSLMAQKQMKQNVATVVTSPLEEEEAQLSVQATRAWGFLDTFVKDPPALKRLGVGELLTPARRRSGSISISSGPANLSPAAAASLSRASSRSPTRGFRPGECNSDEAAAESRRTSPQRGRSASPVRPWLPTGELGHNLPVPRDAFDLDKLLRETRIRADLQSSAALSAGAPEKAMIQGHIAPSQTLESHLVRRQAAAVAAEVAREEARTLDPYSAVQRFLTELMERAHSEDVNKDGVPKGLSAESVARLAAELGYVAKGPAGSDPTKEQLKASADILVNIIANALISPDNAKRARAAGFNYATEPSNPLYPGKTDPVECQIPAQIPVTGAVIAPALTQGDPWRPYSMGVRASMPQVHSAAAPVLAAVSAIESRGGSVQVLFQEDSSLPVVAKSSDAHPQSTIHDQAGQNQQTRPKKREKHNGGSVQEDQRPIVSEPSAMDMDDGPVDSQQFMDAVRVQRHGVLRYAYQLPTQPSTWYPTSSNQAGTSTGQNAQTQTGGYPDPARPLTGYHVTGEQGIDAIKLHRNPQPSGVPSGAGGAGRPDRNPYVGEIPAPAPEMVSWHLRNRTDGTGSNSNARWSWR